MKCKPLIIYFIILFFGVTSIKAQEVSVELPKENIIIRGITTPLNIIVENLSCEDVHVKSKETEIIKHNNCKYNLITQTASDNLILSIYKVANKDTLLITDKGFRVIDLPNPVASIAGRNSGLITENRFKEITKHARLQCYSEHVHADFRVTNYTMIIVRNEEIIGISKNIGNKATDKTKTLIDLVKSGDTVYILDVFSKIMDKTFESDMIKFEITN